MAVSFVVTVYNKRHSLPKVLAAVVAERAQVGGEIILVDDGSGDGSAELLDALAAAEPDVRVLRRPNGGVTAATNTGVLASTGAHVRLVDADDVLVAGSTRTLIDALEHAQAGAAFGAYAERRWDDIAVPLEIEQDWRFAPLTPALDQVVTRVIISPSTALFRGDLLRRVLPLDERYRTNQDFALAARIAAVAPISRSGAVACLGPADEQPGGRLSLNKARMFRDTALISAELGVDWPRRTQRRTVARQAARARLFARRHLKPDRWREIRLLGLRLRAELGLPFDFAAALRSIAAVYGDEA